MARSGGRGATGSTVAVEGLTELVRSFGKLDKKLKRDLLLKLREQAAIVAVTARKIAAEKGLAKPGRSGRGKGTEVRLIKPFYRGASAGVRSGATNKSGFAYPLIHEFGERGNSERGPRAYLEPALVAEYATIVASIDAMLGDLGDAFDNDSD